MASAAASTKHERKKISEKMREAEEAKKPFFSFEYFVPKTPDGILNLFGRLQRMGALGPLFVDVTWGAGGSTSSLTQEICQYAHKEAGLDTQMHLTCTNMEADKFKEALAMCKQEGIRNILALRGDPPVGKEWTATDSNFANGSDLVRYIRQEHGDYFCVGVAGYPEGHPDAASYEEELYWLKQKVDAGADLIISQLFYDCDLFLKWVDDCRRIGIKVPILPGIMPIQNYGGFRRMTGFCKTYVPPEIDAALEPIKSDEQQIKDYGHSLGVEMCRKLLRGGTPGLHFYTLNLEVSAPAVLKTLGLIPDVCKHRELPFVRDKSRAREAVRPVHWANRPDSYVARTASWDDFPNGRWGDARSPAFAGPELVGGHAHTTVSPALLKLAARPCHLPQQLADVFTDYLEGRLPALPWNDDALAPETGPIAASLAHLNRHGFLTINSQPRVNCVPSHDQTYGWGPGGGYCYQKAYVEFFCSPSHWAVLEQELARHPAITYHAVNRAGMSRQSKTGASAVTALTWGVFPGKEIVQPTIVDPSVFEKQWAPEAFSLWSDRWVAHVEPGPSRDFLDECLNTYWLVNLVDNDFVNGDLFEKVFHDIINRRWPFPKVTTPKVSPKAGEEKK